jgi:predicted acylesterase/phospholipase RssA
MQTPASIAFQGGGALGIAHLGAWQRLSERFTIASAAGTSAGAIVAAHCAAGYDPAHVIDIFQSLDWQKMVARQGWGKLFVRMDAWSDGENFYQWLLTRMAARFPGVALRDVTFQRLYQQTGIALTIVACDLNTRAPQPVIFSAETEPGTTIAFAVRASISIPGYFATVPRRDRGQELVDGGVLLNFPARLLHTAATTAGRLLIGIRFEQPLAYLDRPKIWETINRTKDLLLAPGSEPSNELLNDPHYLDVVIDTTGFDSLDFNLNATQKHELVQRGRVAAENALLTYDLRMAQRATASPSAPNPTPVPPTDTPAPTKPERVSNSVTITNTAPNQGAQGTFNAPLTFNYGTQPTHPPTPEQRSTPPTAAALKRASLERRVAALTEEFEAVNQQIDSTLEDAMRKRLERKAANLLAEIERIEAELPQ